MRNAYSLEPDEQLRFDRLKWTKREGAAVAFWKSVAERRGLDPKTIITYEPGTFTALPLGHGKHWCWPSPLRAPPITWRLRQEADRYV